MNDNSWTNKSRLPAGVVLAGGFSSRMGKDKATLRLYGQNGPDLLTRSAQLLSNLLPRVIISGRQLPGYEYCPDPPDGAGPARGIAAALRLTGTSCLVLSCDLPFMDETTLQLLIQNWRARTAGTLLTCFADAESGNIEGLTAVYEPEALPYFDTALATGLIKIARLLPEKRRHLIPYSQQDALPFFNLNYPADMEAARIIIARKN